MTDFEQAAFLVITTMGVRRNFSEGENILGANLIDGTGTNDAKSVNMLTSFAFLRSFYSFIAI